MVEIEIYTEFITLGQFLKLSGLINNGGEAKNYIQNTVILVENEVETRRGRKLRPGMTISIEGEKFLIVGNNEN